MQLGILTPLSLENKTALFHVRASGGGEDLCSVISGKTEHRGAEDTTPLYCLTGRPAHPVTGG